MEELAYRIVAQQGSDLGFADSGSVSVALVALLDEQAASPLSEWSDGDFDGAAMALHDAVNSCGCGGHVAVMGVIDLLDGGHVAEAAVGIAGAARACGCLESQGYLQEALEAIQLLVLSEQHDAEMTAEWDSRHLGETQVRVQSASALGVDTQVVCPASAGLVGKFRSAHVCGSAPSSPSRAGAAASKDLAHTPAPAPAPAPAPTTGVPAPAPTTGVPAPTAAARVLAAATAPAPAAGVPAPAATAAATTTFLAPAPTAAAARVLAAATAGVLAPAPAAARVLAAATTAAPAARVLAAPTPAPRVLGAPAPTD